MSVSIDKLFDFLSEEEVVSRLIYLQAIWKTYKHKDARKMIKNLCYLNQRNKIENDYNPRVNLEIEGFYVL